MLISLTVALTALQPPMLPEGPTFPLEVGRRWTYELDGRPATMLEIVGERRFEGRDLRVLRIRGHSIFWHSFDLLVGKQKGAGLDQFAYTFQDDTNAERRQLIPAKLTVGQRWRSGRFRGKVVARETVKVPAGTFDAFKIDYVLGAHLGTENDLRVWVAPGVGIVQFSKWRESTRGQKRAIQERVYALKQVINANTHAFPVAKLLPGEDVLIRDLIARLATAEPERVDSILRRLARVGRAAVPLLHAATKRVAAKSVHGKRIGRAIACFPKLRLTVNAKPVIAVGQSPKITTRLHNDWATALRVLPALDGSDFARKPAYRIEIRNEADELMTFNVARCGNMNRLTPDDFRKLQPGESFDPFGPGTFSHVMLRWKPEVAGTYRVRVVLDTTGKIPDAWQNIIDGPISKEAIAVLRQLPQGEFVSNEVVFRVKD